MVQNGNFTTIKPSKVDLKSMISSVANSLWPKIGKMGVQKTAKNRPHFKTTFRHFLTPSTIFIAFLCDNFFEKSKIRKFFLKKFLDS